uniref:thioredoxin family protein n=1 Tax=uncultured Allobacillus sp. TaxID=1638025 RepID=UPI0025973D41|nr:thioredoxin family protein [uncultured Allobacillus sp.]
MKTENQYFEEGQTIQAYMENMSKLKKESDKVYHEFQLPDDGFSEQLKAFPVKFLIITEDWCGDAMMINPVIRKLAEAAGKETRVVLRDEDTDLIDRHLTNGSRSIPIVLILNEQGDLLGEWGPRAPEVQQIVDDYREQLPSKEDPDFKEKQKAMIQELTRRYTEEPELWHYVYENFKGTLLVLDDKGEIE